MILPPKSCCARCDSSWVWPTSTQAFVGDIYEQTIHPGEFVGDIYERAIKAGLRVLVYEGDVDGCGLQANKTKNSKKRET